MCARIHCYLDIFASLKGVPHEPLLLLTVLDLVGAKVVNRNFFELSPALERRYESYWALLSTDTNPSATIPFRSLSGAGFWHPVPRPGRELPEDTPPATLDELRTYWFGAKMDEALYPLLVMETSREKLRSVLLDTYFEPQLRVSLLEVARQELRHYR